MSTPSLSPCAACLARGKTWQGSDPKCAFLTGVFDPDNWNCATMSALRAMIPYPVWSEDQNAGLIPWYGTFVALTWYKSRGRTDEAIVVGRGKPTPLRLDFAESILRKEEPEYVE